MAELSNARHLSEGAAGRTGRLSPPPPAHAASRPPSRRPTAPAPPASHGHAQGGLVLVLTSCVARRPPFTSAQVPAPRQADPSPRGHPREHVGRGHGFHGTFTSFLFLVRFTRLLIREMGANCTSPSAAPRVPPPPWIFYFGLKIVIGWSEMSHQISLSPKITSRVLPEGRHKNQVTMWH